MVGYSLRMGNEDLQAALEQFLAIAGDLGEGGAGVGK